MPNPVTIRGSRRKRTKRKLTYHGRTGRPVVHTSDTGKQYIMVRAKGGGTKRLYSGSRYTTNGMTRRLRV